MKSNVGNSLPDRVLKWVVGVIDPEAIVESIQQLKGSTSSILHRISLRVDKTVKHYIVRQFDNEEWLKEEPDLALHEAESLCFAAETGVQTPEIIAFDKDGSTCGVPVVLMTMVDGTVELKPQSMDNWTNELANALVKIHAVEAKGFNWMYFTYNDNSSLEIPSWTSVPDVWQEAIDIVRGPRQSYKLCFIHRDYHPANVLWKENVVSGVVDWVNACRGPAGIDIGHCRVNLAMLYDVKTADSFLSSYHHFARDSFSYNVYWDLVSLIDILVGPPEVYPGWEAFGVTGLTNKMMEERLDNYVVSLLERG